MGSPRWGAPTYPCNQTWTNKSITRNQLWIRHENMKDAVPGNRNSIHTLRSTTGSSFASSWNLKEALTRKNETTQEQWRGESPLRNIGEISKCGSQSHDGDVVPAQNAGQPIESLRQQIVQKMPIINNNSLLKVAFFSLSCPTPLY